jgi:hypothetical protein
LPAGLCADQALQQLAGINIERFGDACQRLHTHWASSAANRLLHERWGTEVEYDSLNRAGRSFSWDAPDGDGRVRYRVADPLA